MYLKCLTRTLLLGILALWIGAGSVQAQRGALVVPRNLAQLVDQSELVIRGHVVSAVVEPHPEYSNLMSVVVSVKVEKCLKGSAAGLYTFRSFISDYRDQADAAGYRKGQELLLLLNPQTRRGFRNTAGLSQGRFEIRRDAKGKPLVSNGKPPAVLLRGLSETASKRGIQFSPRALSALSGKPGTMTLEAMEDMITSLAGGR